MEFWIWIIGAYAVGQITALIAIAFFMSVRD